jgi:hypothetical protein
MRRSVAVCLALFLLVGCGGKNVKGVLSGKITYKGAPVNSATLELFPAAGGEPLPIPVDKEGNFKAKDVPAGEYKVVVMGSAGTQGPNTQGMTKEQLEKAKGSLDAMKQDPTIAFPDKYKKKESTDLKVTVGSGETNQDFPLAD